MDARKLATILVSGLNDLAVELEKALSGDDDGEEVAKKKKKRTTEDDDTEDEDDKPKKKKKTDDDDDGADDEPSEEDFVAAAKKAVKKLDRDTVKKIIKKVGKADAAADVDPTKRQAVLDALDKAIDDAE
jgi:hypothetical protein